MTLLVVDDEEAIRNAMRKYLVQQGYEVAVAATGEEALEVLQRQKVTGILLDVNLPGANGIDLVPRIMELEPTVALLMLTAVNDATSAALCMQRGALDYLLKPVDLAHLGRAISRALERRHTLLEGQQINRCLKEEVALRVAERRLEQVTQERISVATLEALVNALEAKDPFMRGHSARVADLSAIVDAGLAPPTHASGVGPVLTTTTCDYLAPVVYPTDVTVGVRVTAIGRTSITMAYELCRAGRPDELFARATSVIVMIDYATGAKVAVPEPLRRRLQE
jgi:response regulator RpfG family c-di-GMP phosphodiesterase